MPNGHISKKHDGLQRFYLPLLGHEISVIIRSQNRRNKHAHSSTSSSMDVDRAVNRVAHHGRLGGNHRANG